MMRCEKSDGLIVAMMSVPVNAGNSWEDKTPIMRRGPASVPVNAGNSWEDKTPIMRRGPALAKLKNR
jgi:hypothetical protein